jgi:hypothetical protein
VSTTNAPHLVVEIAEKTDKAATNVGAANSALNVISASEAFRKFNWLKNIPVTNSADNLRGMVVSARWRTAFQVSGKIGGVLERVGVVAGLAVNIFHSWHEIETIYSSSEPWDVKARSSLHKLAR